MLGNCKRTLNLITELIQPNKHTAWIESFRQYEQQEFDKVIKREVYPENGPINMGEVVNAVSEATNHEAVLVTGTGNRRRSESDDVMPILQVYEEQKCSNIRRYGNYGILYPGCNRSHIR